MTYKKFKKINIILTLLLGIIFGISISLRYVMLPLITFIIFSLINIWLRRKVKAGEIMADERDLKISGESANLAMKIFSFTGLLIMMVLYFSDTNLVTKVISLTLAFSVSGLMLLYSIIFKIKINKK